MADEVTGAVDFGDLARVVEGSGPAAREDVPVLVLLDLGDGRYQRMTVRSVQFVLGLSQAGDRVFLVAGEKNGYASRKQLLALGLVEED